MRSRWNVPVTLAYMAVCALVLAAIVVNIGVRWPWQHPFRVTAVFSDGNGILAGNEVFMDGVRVGRVDEVRAAGGQARVLMTVDDTHALPLHRDSGAVVRQKNLLNETYIEVSAGGWGAGVPAPPRSSRLAGSWSRTWCSSCSGCTTRSRVSAPRFATSSAPSTR
jgi:ABC-type transporter Mla subunit MlaD